MTQFSYSQYVQAAQAYGSQQGTDNTPPQIGTTDPTLVAAYAVLWLRPGAPSGVVKAAYRSLAAQYHPDAGGDALAMRRLNEAYQTICTSLTT
jgi:DnaJ-class molecular chaperone